MERRGKDRFRRLAQKSHNIISFNSNNSNILAVYHLKNIII